MEPLLSKISVVIDFTDVFDNYIYDSTLKYIYKHIDLLTIIEQILLCPSITGTLDPCENIWIIIGDVIEQTAGDSYEDIVESLPDVNDIDSSLQRLVLDIDELKYKMLPSELRDDLSIELLFENWYKPRVACLSNIR